MNKLICPFCRKEVKESDHGVTWIPVKDWDPVVRGTYHRECYKLIDPSSKFVEALEKYEKDNGEK